jgi:hypothetical protein
MATSHDSALYDKLIRLTHVYLGPAADRFIARQIQNHLNKDPADLTRADLLKLTSWIQLTVSLLTDDNEVVEEYIQQVRNLADEHDSGKKG